MKKIAAFALTMALAGGVLAGCSSAEPEATEAEKPAAEQAEGAVTPEDVTEVEMKFKTPAEVKEMMGDENVVLVDCRTAEKYAEGHIPGVVHADMDAANKGGDIQNGLDTMSAAMKEATGAENGNGKTLIMVCNSGKSYAQVGTNILAALGADMEKVFTLEGGMETWDGDIEK